jgi:uncharacterized membrane protein
MTPPPRDELLESLVRLPPRDVSAPAAARIGRRARARLVTRAQQGPLARAWDVVLEPALTAGFVIAYLGWAMQVAFTLSAGR